MATNAEKTDSEQIHTLALERFLKVQNRERNQRKLATEDAKFVHVEGGQWEEDTVTKRANRPRYTINRVAGAIDQLVGDQRQNRTQIKVRPVTGGANEDIANIYSGLIRNIESQSQAENSYDNAYDETVTGGYGGWRVLTELPDDEVANQDIRIKPINSAATSLWFDPGAKEYDKRDAKWAFLTTNMELDEFREKYPDVNETDFDQEQFRVNVCKDWFRTNVIRIAEYWVKTPVERKIGLLSNGKVIDLGEEEKVLDELQDQGITVVKQRTVQSHKVQMYKMNGAEILEGPKDWAGKFIPLVPVFGKVSNIEGDTFVRGLVRFAKDPQRIFNYSVSATIEATALTPKDPYWETPKQRAGHEEERRTFNVKNQPFLTFNSDPDNPGPPQRTGAPQVQTALVQQSQQAAESIYSTTGIQPPSLGINPELQSGKAIQAQQRMGDRGSFIFQDNQSKSMQYTGDILVDLLPKILDRERTVRILQIDGSTEVININQQSLDDFNQPIKDEQTGEVVIVNDLSRGKYDVITESGPAFNTLRQESAQQMIDLATGNEMFAQLAPDLIAKNLNILENEELTKRVRKVMIGQGIVTPTEEEIEELGLNQPQAPDPTQVAIVENLDAQTENLVAKTEGERADTQKTLIDTQQQTIKSLEILLSAYEKQQKLGIPFGIQEHNLRVTQNDIVRDGQDVTQDGQPNSEQAADLVQQIQGEELTPQ